MATFSQQFLSNLGNPAGMLAGATQLGQALGSAPGIIAEGNKRRALGKHDLTTLDGRIAHTTALLNQETDPAKRLALSNDLATLQKQKTTETKKESQQEIIKKTADSLREIGRDEEADQLENGLLTIAQANSVLATAAQPEKTKTQRKEFLKSQGIESNSPIYGNVEKGAYGHMSPSVFTTFVKDFKETNQETKRNEQLLQNINNRLEATNDENEKNRLRTIASDFELGFIDVEETVKQLRNKEQKQLTYTNKQQKLVDGNIVFVADVTPVDGEKFVGYFDDARKQWLPVSSKDVKDISTPKGIKIVDAPTKAELKEAGYYLAELPLYSDLEVNDQQQAQRRFAIEVETLIINNKVETREEAIEKTLNSIKNQITVEPNTFAKVLGTFSFGFFDLDYDVFKNPTLDKSPTSSFEIIKEQPADKG